MPRISKEERYRRALIKIADGNNDNLLKPDCNGNCELKKMYRQMSCWMCIAKVALEELEVE